MVKVRVPIQGLGKALILTGIAYALRYFVSMDIAWFYLIVVLAYYCIRTEE